MKRALMLVLCLVWAAGCGSSLKTKRIYFNNVPENGDVFVNVVYPESTEHEQEILKLFEENGPEAWFGVHRLYDIVPKDELDVPPCGDYMKRPCREHLVNERKRKRAESIIVIAEYGERLRDEGGRTVIHLPREGNGVAKARSKEYILIGEGYVKRFRKGFWGGFKEE